MHIHRRKIVLARQGEGEFSVAHQRQAFTVGGMHGVDTRLAEGLRAHVLWQFRDLYRAHIDQAVLLQAFEIKWRVQYLTPC